MGEEVMAKDEAVIWVRANAYIDDWLVIIELSGNLMLVLNSEMWPEWGPVHRHGEMVFVSQWKAAHRRVLNRAAGTPLRYWKVYEK